MVVAKNDRAHRALAAQFAGHGRDGGPFERGYLAFVWGAPERPQRHHRRADRPASEVARDRMAVREGGREAVTHWQVLERYGGADKGQPKAEPEAAASRWQASSPAGWKPAAPTRSGCIWPLSVIRSWATPPTAPAFEPRPAFCRRRPRRPGGSWQTGFACLSVGDQTPRNRKNPAVPSGTAGRSASFT